VHIWVTETTSEEDPKFCGASDCWCAVLVIGQLITQTHLTAKAIYFNPKKHLHVREDCNDDDHEPPELVVDDDGADTDDGKEAEDAEDDGEGDGDDMDVDVDGDDVNAEEEEEDDDDDEEEEVAWPELSDEAMAFRAKLKAFFRPQTWKALRPLFDRVLFQPRPQLRLTAKQVLKVRSWHISAVKNDANRGVLLGGAVCSCR
jgi:hypothetical protein